MISVAITTHCSSDQPTLWTTMKQKHQQQRFESQAAVVMKVKDCPRLYGTWRSWSQEEEAFLSLGPCQAAVGGLDTPLILLWDRQSVLQPPCHSWAPGASGTQSHPYFSGSSQSAKQKVKNQPHTLPQHCPGAPMASGVQRKRLCVSQPSQAWAHPHCHSQPWQPPIPTSVGAMGWARATEKSSFTSIKNTLLFFPLDPTSYLLTVVKHCYSSLLSQAGVPLSPILHHPPPPSKAERGLFVCRCTVHWFNATKWRWCERASK